MVQEGRAEGPFGELVANPAGECDQQKKEAEKP